MTIGAAATTRRLSTAALVHAKILSNSNENQFHWTQTCPSTLQNKDFAKHTECDGWILLLKHQQVRILVAPDSFLELRIVRQRPLLVWLPIVSRKKEIFTKTVCCSRLMLTLVIGKRRSIRGSLPLVSKYRFHVQPINESSERELLVGSLWKQNESSYTIKR